MADHLQVSDRSPRGQQVKDSRLCTQCRDLNLQADAFYLPPIAAAYRNKEDSTDSIQLGSRSWASIKAEQECSLCRLMVSAVEATSRQWHTNDVPHICKISTPRMTLDASYRNSEEKKVDWDLRTLTVVAKYGRTESDQIHLLPVQSDESSRPFIGRRLENDFIDITQILGWLHQCKTEHNQKCPNVDTTWSLHLQQDLLVIDVHNYCLTKLPPNQRYLALSYVWGGVSQLHMDSKLFEQSKKPGGLSSIAVHIPATVVDAITLVKLLNERYLWVDALCIVKDDHAFVQTMIDRMHIIYRHAFLTIIAATGDDANAGLPGVSGPRSTAQKYAEVSDDLTFILPMHYLAIKDSTWASRAWTYQEYFFSTRRLIFFAGQVVYQCNTMRWREDVAQEGIKGGITYYQINIGGDRMDWEPPGVGHVSNHWDRNRYVEYLETYVDRSLTKDGDIQRAFTGILNDASEKGLETFFGLTKSHFAIDLLWQPCRWLLRRPGFPSWSWLGWKGAVIMFKPWPDFASAKVCAHRASWIRFFSFDEDRESLHLIGDSYSPKRDREVMKEEYTHFLREKARKAFKRYRVRRSKAATLLMEQRSEAMQSASYDRLREARRKIRKREEDIKSGSSGEELGLSDDWDDNIESGVVLTPLLHKLANESDEGKDAIIQRNPVEKRSTDCNKHHLFFRTMTGMLTISPLKPNGELPRFPPREDPFLPTAPSLYLYASDSLHVGTAWVYSSKMYDEMVFASVSATGREQQVEIAVLAGPVRADWRTREEMPPLKQIMNELVLAGCNSRDNIARYMTRAEYHNEVGRIALQLMKERFSESQLERPLEELGLDEDFWNHVEAQVRQLNLPGHDRDMFDDYKDQIMNTNSSLRVDVDEPYFRVMLMGILNSEMSSGTGKSVEIFGQGEIKADYLSLIERLAFRDVRLR